MKPVAGARRATYFVRRYAAPAIICDNYVDRRGNLGMPPNPLRQALSTFTTATGAGVKHIWRISCSAAGDEKIRSRPPAVFGIEQGHAKTSDAGGPCSIQLVAQPGWAIDLGRLRATCA